MLAAAATAGASKPPLSMSRREKAFIPTLLNSEVDMELRAWN
jgi:hypothetical protein